MKRDKFHIPPKCVGWEDLSTLQASSSGSPGWGSGRIIYFKNEKSAHASPALIWGFRRAGSKGVIKLVDSNNLPDPWAYMLYVYRHENSFLTRGEALHLLAEAYRKNNAPLPFEFQHQDGSIPLGEDIFRKVVESWLGEIALSTSKDIENLAKLVAAVDRVAAAEMSNKEEQFLKAVEIATVATSGVPTQKEVMNHWDSMGTLDMKRGNRDTFRQTRDLLGFDWLPPGANGKGGD